MSDLCPVYAPFFGAMVSAGDTGLCRAVPDSTGRTTGLHQCHRLHLCVFWFLGYDGDLSGVLNVSMLRLCVVQVLVPGE